MGAGSRRAVLACRVDQHHRPFHQVSHSPLETNPILRTTTSLLRRFNPALFALSALASIWLLAGWARKHAWAPAAPVLVAAFCVYVTLVHVVFQAEPRYSIPYRPMQVLMLATALAAAWGTVRHRVARQVPAPG